MSIKNEILNKMPLSLVTYMRDHKSSGNKSQEIYRNIGVGVDFSSQHKVLLCYVTEIFHIQKWEKQKGRGSAGRHRTAPRHHRCTCRGQRPRGITTKRQPLAF